MKHNIITSFVIAVFTLLILAVPARAGLLDSVKKAKDTVQKTKEAPPPKQQSQPDAPPASPPPPAQQSTPQQDSGGSQTQSQPFTVTPDMSPKDIAQAWLDAIYAGDVQKAEAIIGKGRAERQQQENIKSWEMAQKWGGKPVKYVIERVESDFDKTHVYFRPVVGLEPKLTFSKESNGVWRAIPQNPMMPIMNTPPFGIALPGDEGEWKEGSPAKVARTWFDAMAAEDWEKVSSVSDDDGGIGGRSESAALLRAMKVAREAGKKILPVTIDYLEFGLYGNDYAYAHCSTGKEKYSLMLFLKGDVWLVYHVPEGQENRKWQWPTKEFWEGVKLQ